MTKQRFVVEPLALESESNLVWLMYQTVVLYAMWWQNMSYMESITIGE
jgi:hypothetical protein